MNIFKDWLVKKENGEKALAILVDPDKIEASYLEQLVAQANEGNINYFFVGGSLITTNNLDYTINFLKRESKVPVILFPGSTLQVNTNADAILFLSLISGRNPELLIGKHVEAAPIISASKLEVISTGYMIVESGKATSASYMSNTQAIPYDKPEIAACTAMAGEMLGLKCNYLEAGSGAVNSVSCEMVKRVAKACKSPLIVGGGIRDKETAKVICDAGADIIVMGTSIESKPDLVKSIAKLIQSYKIKAFES
ncbi:MAG: geranylgeranylglyceryl/heptaprenylglyceryl phosphate synthase [Bacteroidetes bacterium]|nr:geranylgeranylglyceryl/heptaprenylglyceryl phosphate synthase [Bacteroidota bacterium]